MKPDPNKSASHSIVQRIQNLPTLPQVGKKILALASDPDVSLADLSNAIHQDPPLAARVLKVANSPFYGMPRQVDSLQLALVVLGLNEVRNIALGLMIFNTIKGLDARLSYYQEKFWTHCVGFSMVARILGRKLQFSHHGVEFVSGLLHDMGKIIIDGYFGNKFVPVFNKTFAHAPPMIEAEEEILGESHTRIGYWLADKWRLPRPVCEAILYHHDFPPADSSATIEDARLIALCYIAEAICGCNGIGWDGDSACAEAKKESAWKVLLSHQTTYTLRDIDRLIGEVVQTYNTAPPVMLWD